MTINYSIRSFEEIWKKQNKIKYKKKSHLIEQTMINNFNKLKNNNPSCKNTVKIEHFLIDELDIYAKQYYKTKILTDNQVNLWNKHITSRYEQI